jgi:hypothetical protein
MEHLHVNMVACSNQRRQVHVARNTFVYLLPVSGKLIKFRLKGPNFGHYVGIKLCNEEMMLIGISIRKWKKRQDNDLFRSCPM